MSSIHIELMKTLHEEFQHSEESLPASNLLAQCKELLYRYPAGQHLVNILNLHHIPVRTESADKAGYHVENHSLITLQYPESKTDNLYEMSIYLGCAIRIVELHLQTYLSPETKDSRAWLNPHMTESFEVILTICKLAYDMNYDAPNKDVNDFLDRHNYRKIYDAYLQKKSFSELENLMLKSFNTRH